MASVPPNNRHPITKLPEVVAYVVSDREGMLLEANGDIDGEAVGAVYAVSADALARAGDTLGLGELQRASVAGPKTACIVSVHAEEIVGLHLDPRKPMAAFETKLEGALRR
jgi:predicted regulator of Ras-like GTPase activity (Roadblock/LC7/MglB family)